MDSPTRCRGLPRGAGSAHRLAVGRALYPERRLVLEVAGHRTHSTRRDRQGDAERKLALELDGYDVAELTYEDVTERPGYVVRRVLQLLADGGRRRSVA